MKLYDCMKEFIERMDVNNKITSNIGTYIVNNINLINAKIHIHYRGTVEHISIYCDDYKFEDDIHFWKDIPIKLNKDESSIILMEMSRYLCFDIPEFNPTGDKHGDFILSNSGLFDIEHKKWVSLK